MTPTLFHGIRQLVSLQPLVERTPSRRLNQADLGMIENAAILADKNGTVEWVGPKNRAPSSRAKKIDLNAEVVLPGFVDAHTHLIFAGDRADEFRRRAAGATYQEIAAEGGGILTTMKATRLAAKKDLKKIAKARVDRAKSFGITTLEVKSGYALNESGEKKILQVATELQKESDIRIIRTYLGAHAFPHDVPPEKYMEFLKRSLVTWYKQKLYDHLDMFTEEKYFSIEQSIELIHTARAHHIPFKIHADEFSALGGSRLGAKLGALSVDHCLHYLGGASMDETINLFKKSSTVPVFLPGTAFFLKLPYADPRPLLENGIPVALATDFNPGSSMTQNLPLMMTLATLYMHMNVEETLAATTIQAARALGLCSSLNTSGLIQVGALAPGFSADFQVFDVPYSHLAYSFGSALVRLVVSRGRNI